MRISRICAIAICASLPAAAGAADVGVTVNIGEPGFFGQINIGNAPPPPVMYAQPMVIEAAPPDVRVEPLYLRVPPGHERDWKHHCHEYHACNRPVYFVREDWYQHNYGERRHERMEGERHERQEERRERHEEEHRDRREERDRERDR